MALLSTERLAGGAQCRVLNSESTLPLRSLNGSIHQAKAPRSVEVSTRIQLGSGHRRTNALSGSSKPGPRALPLAARQRGEGVHQAWRQAPGTSPVSLLAAGGSQQGHPRPGVSGPAAASAAQGPADSASVLAEVRESRDAQGETKKASSSGSGAGVATEVGERANGAAALASQGLSDSPGQAGHGANGAIAGGEGGTATGKADEEWSTGEMLWKVIKPPLYSVAFIPLLVGAAAAYLQHGSFSPGRFWSFLLNSVLIIAWLNLSNDAFDAETGVDKEKKESVVNITGSRVGVLVVSKVLLALGGFGLLRGAMAVSDMRVFQLLAAAIFCGYIYQSPPFRLSYKGLGEPLCFVAFGPLATSAFYLYQASSPGVHVAVGPTALAASVLVGITTSLILFCSHFHQVESDLAVGKMSPLVRLGTARGAQVLRAAVVGLYASAAAFCAAGALPLVALVPLGLTIPVARAAVSFVQDNHTDKSTIFMAKYMCTRLHIAFGVMLALGLALGRRFPISL